MPVDNAVEWVTPVLIGGYQATGSIAGSLLQLFNIGVGVFIYRWFLIRFERAQEENKKRNMEQLVETIKTSEKSGAPLSLLNQKGNVGAVARILAEDLNFLLSGETTDSFALFVQPQCNIAGRCTGAETLFRWDHPQFGMLYPPLVFMIAKEAGLLDKLERHIFEIACKSIKTLRENGACPEKVSVNLTAASFQNPEFFVFIEDLVSRNPEVAGILDVELTEQMSFHFSKTVENTIRQVRETGISFCVDDFSMGHTSIKYLQSDLFDAVKLDGSIVGDMIENERSLEIISSLLNLSRSIGFSVVAECVETKEQTEALESLGCEFFQGYYYSRPLKIEDFIAWSIENAK